MDMMSSIADMSMAMSATKVQQQLSTSMLKKAMETEQAAVAQIFESMPPAFPGENGYIFNATA